MQMLKSDRTMMELSCIFLFVHRWGSGFEGLCVWCVVPIKNAELWSNGRGIRWYQCI